MMTPLRTSLVPLLIFALISLSGCQGGNTITGTVNCDGKPLEKGAISFTPEDGRGNTAGGMIASGKYTATRVPSGKVRIVVTADAGVNYPTSRDEAKTMTDGQLRGTTDIQANDDGNSQVMEITSSTKEINIDIKRRPRR